MRELTPFPKTMEETLHIEEFIQVCSCGWQGWPDELAVMKTCLFCGGTMREEGVRWICCECHFWAATREMLADYNELPAGLFPFRNGDMGQEWCPKCGNFIHDMLGDFSPDWDPKHPWRGGFDNDNFYCPF